MLEVVLPLSLRLAELCLPGHDGIGPNGNRHAAVTIGAEGSSAFSG